LQEDINGKVRCKSLGQNDCRSTKLWERTEIPFFSIREKMCFAKLMKELKAEEWERDYHEEEI